MIARGMRNVRRRMIMTNGERIRMMNDEELADLFGRERTLFTCPVDKSETECANTENCGECFYLWLKQEAKQDDLGIHQMQLDS